MRNHVISYEVIRYKRELDRSIPKKISKKKLFSFTDVLSRLDAIKALSMI